MWMVNPRVLCRKHLLGEHVELHMFVAGLRREIDLSGYLKKKLLEPHNIERRHAELVGELERRGYQHRSPLPKFAVYRAGKIDRRGNMAELARRCRECRKIQQKLKRAGASNCTVQKARKKR